MILKNEFEEFLHYITLLVFSPLSGICRLSDLPRNSKLYTASNSSGDQKYPSMVAQNLRKVHVMEPIFTLSDFL